MKRIAFASLVAAITLNVETVQAQITFEQALALAEKRVSRADAMPEVAGLRQRRLPSVRAEVTGNASRTLDLFVEGPLESRYAASVIAFDWPLWGPDASAALPSLFRGTRLDDARFTQLVEAFGELYFTQRQLERLRPLAQQLTADAARAEALLSQGEISNLTAAERRDAAVAYATQIVDLEGRRLAASARLKMLTGVEEEPRVVIDTPSSGPSGHLLPQAGEGIEDDLLRASTLAVEQNRARYRALTTGNGLRAMLSGFGGFGAASSDFRGVTGQGSFGIYGLRVHLSYPLLGPVSGAAAEARFALDQSIAARDAALDAARTRAVEYRAREESWRGRVALLRQSVEAAREREASVRRLVNAGVRNEGDLTLVQADRVRREGELLSAEVERWKADRLLARLTRSEDSAQP